MIHDTQGPLTKRDTDEAVKYGATGEDAGRESNTMARVVAGCLLDGEPDIAYRIAWTAVACDRRQRELQATNHTNGSGA